MAEQLSKKKKSRNGHKLYSRKCIQESKDILSNPIEENKTRIAHLKCALEDQIETITLLDREILELLSATDEEAEQLAVEIEETCEFKTEMKSVLGKLKELQTSPVKSLQHSPTGTKNKSVKLPKLEMKKFNGRAEKWQEFWDSYESAIHVNKDLSDIDTFSYLRGLLEEPARTTVAGFSLTSANYKDAVELLKRRYGKPVKIKRAHMNELLNLKPIYSGREIDKVRKLYDIVETNHRGLKALGVDESSYCTVVVPSILEKLPEVVRLSVTRGRNYNEWSLDEMLPILLEEIELREDQTSATGNNKESSERRIDNSGKLSTASALFAKTLNNCCAYCKGVHNHKDCSKITNIAERKQLIRKYGRCFICIQKGHLAKNCDANYSCNNCKGKHHVSICESKGHVEPTQSTPSTRSVYSSPTFHIGANCRVALQTAQAVVHGNKKCKVRVLFDSGSHRSFVTQMIVKSAGLGSIRKEWIEISTFGQGKTDSGLREVYEIEVLPVHGGTGKKIEAYAVPSISQIRNDHIEIRKQEYSHLQGLWFSDVCHDKEVLEIDLLIGADYLWCFQGGRTIRGESDEPVAVETNLGWVLSGPMKTGRCDDKVNVHFVSQEVVSNFCELERDVKKLWDFETLGIRKEDEVHEALKDAISFNGERYQVCLPWKEGHGVLPINYENSLKRLKGQVGKLRKEPDILSEYASIIKEQADKGIIEPVIELEKSEKVHYLPHHAVVRQDAKSTKVRIVYDASSRTGKKSLSLNDCLHVGPPLTPLLYNVLLRFREKRIALVGDIEKAFLNIEVCKEDRDCLRFLWVKDVENENIEPVVYRFCRVVFGVNCSPFLLNATLQYHLDSFAKEDEEFVRKLKNSFYVDDLASGDRTEDETFELYEKAKLRLAKGGFRLRKWLTNSSGLRDRIKEREADEETVNVSKDDQTYAKNVLGGNEGLGVEKVLGMMWNCDLDTFILSLKCFAEKAKGLVVTKRNILSILASVYDPLGIISPVVVSMKMFFQELCADKIGWDDQLDEKKVKQWDNWVKDLDQVQEISIPRCFYGISEWAQAYSLHGFADASSKAYCAVIYVVSEFNGDFNVELLTSKTRVAPLKVQTIPRLELMSGRVLAQLVETVKNALQGEIKLTGTHLWLDSKTALCWINNRGEWKQFVRHRVNEILRLTRREDWRHCPGEENPADLGSRGVRATRLRDNNLWWKGPKWLSGPKEEWPDAEEIVENIESLEEVKKYVVMTTKVINTVGIGNVIDVKRFSEYNRLLRVSAWVKRFVYNMKTRLDGKARKTDALQRAEMIEAETAWIQEAQAGVKSQEHFKQLERELGLVVQSGIFRCVGRLGKADLEAEGRQPIFLPREHKFTELIIQYCHTRVHHSGLRSTLAELRSRFWVSKGRQVVKRLISQCVICKRFQGKSFKAPCMAELPEFRVKEVPPFSKVGVDFAGPLYVKNKAAEMEKVYIALWTCCVTRAVSLDLTVDLATPTFLRSLRRFAARHGTPTLIVSDNAKTFKAASKYLKKLFDDLEVKAYLENNRIEWRFNLERAPWWGGFFERMVGTVKSCLRKVLGNAKLSYDELLTNLLEIERTINSRPLTYEYSEVGVEVLTPSHLIFGRRLASMPDEIRNDEDEDECSNTMLKRFRYLARVRTHFWNRWRKEYLVDLRESHKGLKQTSGKTVAKGDVVLVQEDKVKRGSWKLAVVEDLVKGSDGEFRGASVRMITKGKPVCIRRPVQKLYPLEVQSKETVVREVVNESKAKQNVEIPQVRQRDIPMRAAAKESIRRTKAVLDL